MNDNNNKNTQQIYPWKIVKYKNNLLCSNKMIISSCIKRNMCGVSVVHARAHLARITQIIWWSCNLKNDKYSFSVWLMDRLDILISLKISMRRTQCAGRCHGVQKQLRFWCQMPLMNGIAKGKHILNFIMHKQFSHWSKLTVILCAIFFFFSFSPSNDHFCHAVHLKWMKSEKIEINYRINAKITDITLD